MKTYINFLRDISEGAFISNSKYGTKIGLKKRNNIQIIFWLYLYYTGISILVFGQFIQNEQVGRNIMIYNISGFILLYLILVSPFVTKSEVPFSKIADKQRKLRIYYTFVITGVIIFIIGIVYAVYLSK